ncbi:MAG: ABC transporter ATP-binding protein [Acidimicrobiia bacterium]
MKKADTPPLLADGLTRQFDDEMALDHFDLSVQRGEIHAVVGLNGAGKTTLMRLLLGMLRPDAGSARVLGFEAHEAPSRVWSHVGHLIETPFAYPELTVEENVEAAALLHGVETAELAGLVERAVGRFGLAHWARRRARSLSLGNRQRLGLASATVHQPLVLVLDEPANALDPAGVVFIRDLLGEYRDRGAAILVSSHHFDQLARVADRITVLHRGRHVGELDSSGVDLESRFFEIVYQADLTDDTASP